MFVRVFEDPIVLCRDVCMSAACVLASFVVHLKEFDAKKVKSTSTEGLDMNNVGLDGHQFQ